MTEQPEETTTTIAIGTIKFDYNDLYNSFKPKWWQFQRKRILKEEEKAFEELKSDPIAGPIFEDIVKDIDHYMAYGDLPKEADRISIEDLCKGRSKEEIDLAIKKLECRNNG